MHLQAHADRAWECADRRSLRLHPDITAPAAPSGLPGKDKETIMTAAARQIIEARSDRKQGMTGAEGPAVAASTGPAAAEVYALGSNPGESARLQRKQSGSRVFSKLDA